MPGGDSHRGKSLKLLEKIPEDAEATVVLVGKEGRALGAGGHAAWAPPLRLADPRLWLAGCLPQPHPGPHLPMLFLTARLAPRPFFPSSLPASLPAFCYLGQPLVPVPPW